MREVLQDTQAKSCISQALDFAQVKKLKSGRNYCMKKTISLLVVLVLVFAKMLTGCAPKAEPEAEPAATPEAAAPTEAPKAEPLKVGFVYIGSANDGGYTQAHDEGRRYLEQQLGDKVVTMFKEGVPESSECEKVINDLVDQGCTVIFANSFGHMDFVEKAAKEKFQQLNNAYDQIKKQRGIV